MIISENRSLAESNLEMEPRLIEARSRINELTQEGKLLLQTVQEKLQQISESFETNLRTKARNSTRNRFRVEIIKR